MKFIYLPSFGHKLFSDIHDIQIPLFIILGRKSKVNQFHVCVIPTDNYSY